LVVPLFYVWALRRFPHKHEDAPSAPQAGGLRGDAPSAPLNQQAGGLRGDAPSAPLNQ
jgi:hypothetical protein